MIQLQIGDSIVLGVDKESITRLTETGNMSIDLNRFGIDKQVFIFYKDTLPEVKNELECVIGMKLPDVSHTPNAEGDDLTENANFMNNEDAETYQVVLGKELISQEDPEKINKVIGEFIKRTRDGIVLCEIGFSDDLKSAQTNEERFDRVMTIKHNNVCCRIVDAYFDYETKQFIGLILPLGPKSHLIKDHLKTGQDYPFYFGLRGLKNGTDITNIITFDVVFTENQEAIENDVYKKLNTYKQIGFTEKDKHDESGIIRLEAYRALGFTEESKKDKFWTIRLEAYRALGFTEEALTDEELLIRNEAQFALSHHH